MTSTSSSVTSSTSSISGLVSGLDTSSVISSLMALASAPKTQLQSRLASEKTKLSTLQSLNSSIASLATAATKLNTASGWNPVTATSSSTGVAVTALSDAAGGDYTMTVNSVASGQRNVYSTTAALSQKITGSSDSIKLTVGGKATELDTGDGSLEGVVKALNATGTGVKATTVKLDDGTYRLVVNAGTTGSAGTFTLTADDGSDLLGGATTAAAKDASVTLNGDTVTSSTNTFNGVLSGLSFTVSAAAVGTEVTLSAATDAKTMGDNVKSLVDSVNSILSNLDSLTSTDTSSPGTFSGDVTMTTLRTSLLNTVFGSDNKSLASYGIQTNRDGTIDFDQTTFQNAFSADPDAVTAAFAGSKDSDGKTVDGFVDRIYAVAKSASDSTTGLISSLVTSENSTIKSLNDQITTWTDRLAQQQATLQSKFNALETTMSKLNSTSSWLTSQIKALEGSSDS